MSLEHKNNEGPGIPCGGGQEAPEEGVTRKIPILVSSFRSLCRAQLQTRRPFHRPVVRSATRANAVYADARR